MHLCARAFYLAIYFKLIIGTPLIKDLMNEITPRYFAYWTEIGTLLDIPQETLNIIKHDYSKHGDWKCCNRMFEEWLKKGTSATWEKLHAAIKSPAITAFADQDDSAG